ncbi:MAG: M81 family metallopeptidase [Acidimicrobiales bacterium]
MRLAVGGIIHETNTYADESAGPTRLDAFTVRRGAAIVENGRGTGAALSGMLEACEELGHEVVPLLWALAWPSGTIAADAYATLKADLLDALRAAMPVDAIALDLHGAGVVDGVGDLEGDLGRAIRDVVGDDVPVVAAFDLHGNATDAMAAVFDGGLYACHLYPHTDLPDRGREIVGLAARLLGGDIEPITCIEHLPMLLPPATTATPGPAQEMHALCARVEAQAGVIDCSVFHGFPFVDVADVGVHVVCTADGDEELARSGAREVASWIWANRERFRHENDTPEGAVRHARGLVAAGTRPVVINETNDNPGGGAPGDATHLLRAMLDARVERACFAFINDPAVVNEAIQAGPGAVIETQLGGKHDALHGEPIAARAYVKAITDGRFRLKAMLEGTRLDLGPSVRLRIEDIDVIVTSKPFQTIDDGIFVLHGIEVREYDVIGLKSSQHFRAGFGDLAGAIVTSDAPGLTTTRTEVFDRLHAPGPLWPKDPDASWP